MAGQPLEFSFERVLWQSRLWIDGEEVAGAQESFDRSSSVCHAERSVGR